MSRERGLAMRRRESGGGRPSTRVALGIVCGIPILAALVVFSGLGLVAFLGQRGDEQTWLRWSSVGEAFGAVNSIVSAIAVAVLVITWTLQSRDLRKQWAELTRQREILDETRAALCRSADADLRKLHVSLIRMAIDKPHLARVWPSDAAFEQTVREQHLYANLLLQHVWLQYTLGVATREEMVNNVRFLFASPEIRAFWRDTTYSRNSVYVENTDELTLAATANQIFQEYEAVLACSDPPTSRRRGDRAWAAEDLQGSAWHPTANSDPPSPPAACP